ncbi:unnamed protein product [Brachionus calyciflorus]|uniref:Uncharacterized protein n=1 Tax=Brachionus calyciflorus TaxID=104777 RepID=A0A813QU20_9BILA|nr:unnamed protein product [Brachionus calyciflorus]
MNYGELILVRLNRLLCFKNWSKNHESRDFYLNGIKVQKVDSLVHLGLPVGDHVFKENYWDEKFKKVQKALYSLNAFGRKPKVSARLYSIYYQPIFNYDVAKIIDLDPFTEDAKVCVDALDQFYVSKITQTDKAELYRKIVHLCDLFSKDQVYCVFYIDNKYKFYSKTQETWLKLKKIKKMNNSEIVLDVSSDSNLSTTQSSSNLIESDNQLNRKKNKKSSYITLVIMFTLNLINYSDRFTIAGKYHFF